MAKRMDTEVAKYFFRRLKECILVGSAVTGVFICIASHVPVSTALSRILYLALSVQVGSTFSLCYWARVKYATLRRQAMANNGGITSLFFDDELKKGVWLIPFVVLFTPIVTLLVVLSFMPLQWWGKVLAGITGSVALIALGF